MARKVTELPGRSRNSEYPWDQWFDGDVWELEQGEDFTTSVEGMRSVLHGAAKRLGYALSTRVRDGLIYVQATPLELDGEE